MLPIKIKLVTCITNLNGKVLKYFLKLCSFLLSTIQFQYNCVTCILSKRCKQAWVVLQGMALLRVKKVKRKGWTLKNPSKLLFVERGLEVNEKKSNLHLMQIYTKIGVQDSPKHHEIHIHFFPCRLENRITNYKSVFFHDRKELVWVPKEARTDAFIHFSLLILLQCRCCR